IVCFAGAATGGDDPSSMNDIYFIGRKIIFWNYRNGTEGMDFQTYLLTLHRTFHSADIIKKHPQ
uniref:hypothetical protein n=1 Tax=Prevotella sp. TaxID=59823 RepID=UPI003FEFA6FE